MEEYLRNYLERTPRSAELYRRAGAVMPGGVSHNPRYFPPHPVYIRKAEGARIWDVDGNEYIDLWMGHYAHILGHRPEPIRKALREGIEEGTHWGVAQEIQVALAEEICDLFPAAEMMRFGVTGTEAAMYAVRLARGTTGRRTIIKVKGGWHGAGPDLSLAVHAPMDRPESAGLLPEIMAYVKTIPFNDAENAVRIIRENADDLAAVIIEAVGQYFIPPQAGFLEAVQEATKRAGAVFILDEVITGFRLALRGAQGRYDLKPDLLTLGKVLGGGMPLAVVAGRRDIMGLADPTRGLPKGSGVLIGGGTFSEMPLALRTARAMLSCLKENEQEVYPALEAKGKKVREGLAGAFQSAGIAVKISGVGSLLNTAFVDSEANCRNVEDIDLLSDLEARDRLFHLALLSRGVYTKYGGGAVSLAHTDADLEKIIEAVRGAAGEMAQGNFLSGRGKG